TDPWGGISVGRSVATRQPQLDFTSAIGIVLSMSFWRVNVCDNCLFSSGCTTPTEQVASGQVTPATATARCGTSRGSPFQHPGTSASTPTPIPARWHRRLTGSRDWPADALLPLTMVRAFLVCGARFGTF